MNEKLREYLRSINVGVLNPIQKSITDKTEVGWHCVSGADIRMNSEIINIRAFIFDNDLPYTVVDSEEYTKSFFIYK